MRLAAPLHGMKTEERKKKKKIEETGTEVLKQIEQCI